MNDIAAAQDKVSRVMVMFSEGIGATTTLPEDIGVHALDLGIPIYPVATNYQNHIHSGYPRNLWRMHQFEDLGKLTGGRSVEYASIDAPLLLKILDSFKADALAQYVIGFVPNSNASLKRHNLEVRMAKKSSGSVEGGKAAVVATVFFGATSVCSRRAVEHGRYHGAACAPGCALRMVMKSAPIW